MIRCAIFDLDGVVADAQWIHAKAQSDLIQRYGVSITPQEITTHYAGVSSKTIFKDFLGAKGIAYDVQQLYGEKRKLVSDMVPLITPISGVKELIQLLHNNKFKLAVASSPDSHYVNSVLRHLGLSHYFGAIVSGDQVANGKPAPDIFLKAAQMLDVDPLECVVIEDAVAGMKGAIAGSMKCIGVVAHSHEATALDYPTPNLVTSLDAITLDYLARLQ